MQNCNNKTWIVLTNKYPKNAQEIYVTGLQNQPCEPKKSPNFIVFALLTTGININNTKCLLPM